MNFLEGRYAEAESLYQRALAIREKTEGRESLEVAWTLHGLGEVYTKQGRYAEAEACYQQALVIRENGGPTEFPSLARTLLGPVCPSCPATLDYYLQPATLKVIAAIRASRSEIRDGDDAVSDVIHPVVRRTMKERPAV